MILLPWKELEVAHEIVDVHMRNCNHVCRRKTNFLAWTGTSYASEVKQNISPIYLADKKLGAKGAKGWSTTHIMLRVNFAVLMSIKNSPDCGRVIEQAKLNKAGLSNKEEQQILASGIDLCC
jgi:hypothetical protein